MSFETIAIGDEILTGKITDTNSTFVADQLFTRGYRLQRQTVVLDDIADIQAAIREASARADFAVCFGGLGPTSDDKTAEAVLGLIGGSLVTHDEAKARLLKRFAELKRNVTPAALKQVLYPSAADPILNLKGLAPGFSARLGRCRFYFLPGVPHEMKAMVLDHVLPDIESRRKEAADPIGAHVWRCLDIPESDLQTLMNPVEADLPRGAWLGYRTRYPENHLTLYMKASAGGPAVFDPFVQRIRKLLATWTYAEGNVDLEELVVDRLKQRGWRVALAESCTAGLVTERLGRVAGASDVLWGGFVTYRVEAKQAMLGVKLDSPGQAVSADCTRRLADATLRASGCELAAAVTGYAGPTGESVGTVYLCVISKKGVWEKKLSLIARERTHVQWGAATHLLNGLRIGLE